MTALRVLVYYRAPAERPEAVRDAHRQAARDLTGVPGLDRQQLLASADDPGAHVLLMEWAGVEPFEAWEREFRARAHPSPLRPYQDRARHGGHYESYLVKASFS